jgi:crotonobetainyl-CoA:carnitine CoA-transferase CaiB-like acyl-CoA transferase
MMDVDSTTGVLSGIRVADFSRVLAGPYASMLLADFGADVIKIESSDGDETRAWLPPLGPDGQSAYFGSVNRNKRSVVCDLSTEAGLAHARELAMTADVVLENFRPGVMSKFGLDYESVRAQNLGTVYCSITGFGSSAAGAELAGYDLLVQAMSGLMSITGDENGAPSKVGVALVDVLCGQNAVAGILLALRSRDAHPEGHGQRVEVDLMSTALSSLVNQAGNALATGVAPRRLGNAHPSISPYELYSTKSKPIIIAIGSDRHFRVMCGVLALENLADDNRFSTNPQRVVHRDQLKALMEAALATATAEEWVTRLASAGLPAGPVNTIPEAIAFAESIGLAPTVDVPGSPDTTSIRNPIRLSESPARYELSPPRLGEHPETTWLTARTAQER